MIYVNGRNLGSHLTGVQRYTLKITDEWNKSGFSFNTIIPKSALHSVKGHLWEQFILPMKVDRSSLLWSPSNTGPLSVSNQVVTIHDVVPLDHPEWLNKKFVMWYQYLLPRLAKKAHKIITISEFSKERIIDTLKIPEHKVSVVYNGVDVKMPGYESIKEHKIKLPFNRYILSVGSIEPRKNIGRLIAAWKKIVPIVGDDIGLVIVGAKGLSRVFLQSENLSNVNSADRVYFTGHVSDEQLSALYSHAEVFCYPSLYEGFGLPPLEAMAYSIPVLTSNTTAMAEICKGAATLVDPISVNEIADGIVDLLSSHNVERIEFARQLSKSLTWDKCAQATWNVINEKE